MKYYFWKFIHNQIHGWLMSWPYEPKWVTSLHDWSALKWAKTKQAICIIIKRDGLYLGVSRRNDYTKFGLPAGKINKGEIPYRTAYRELKEETGIVIVNSITLLDERIRDDGYVYCYLIETDSDPDLPEALIARGEGIAKWVDKQVLFDGPFGDYNKNVFKEYNL